MKTNSPKSNLFILKSSLKSWRIWLSLALQDILLRYRGSVIGPFWITVSTAITVFSMGILYGILFGMERSNYLPYFTAGLITWQFISMIVMESTKIFLESKPYMDNFDLPCLVYVYRMIIRNVIIWAHNLPVYLLIALMYGIDINLNTLLILPGLIILSINAALYGTIIALTSARFPDIGAIIANILQVLFFITPIMWVESALPERFHAYLKLNPLYYFVNIMRDPLLGKSFQNQDLIAMGILTFTGAILMIPLIKRYAPRVIFWL